MSEGNNTFEFTYSANEQEEIKKIREKYVCPQEKEVDKMEELRRLDESVTRKGTIVALLIGIIGTLVMGTGMSLVMTDLGNSMGVQLSMAVGIISGIIGMAGVAAAYPLYAKITQKERERIAPRILRLSDELLK